MNDLSFNNIPFWVSNGIALLSILLTIFFYFRSKRKPDLRYEILSKNRLLSDSEELHGKVKIFFENNEVKDVNLLIIRLFNDGNLAIKNNDYEKPISLSFGEKAIILSATILETFPKELNENIIDFYEKQDDYLIYDNMIIIGDDKKSIIFPSIILNPKSSITVKIFITNYYNEIIFKSSIANINKIEQRKPPHKLLNLLFLIGSTLFLVSLFLSMYFRESIIVKILNYLSMFSLFIYLFIFLLELWKRGLKKNKE